MPEFQFTIPIRGQEVEVTHRVTARDDGAFASYSATVNDKQYREDSLPALRDKLMTAMKQAAAKISVPFVSLGIDRRGKTGWVLLPGVFTGIHAATNKLLYRMTDGEHGQMDRYGGRTSLRPMPDDVGQKLVTLLNQRDALNAEIETLQEPFKMDAEVEVKAAIIAAVEKADAQPAEVSA